MSENGVTLLGDLGKPAEALINRISDAVGGIAAPWQIKRVSKATAEAEVETQIILAEGEARLSELQKRAFSRLAHEEARKQENIESISFEALPHLKDQASPEEIDQDWLANFFDQARNISNEEIQSIWARLLAEEANKPNSVRNSTLAILRSLSHTDAKKFEKLLRLSINMGNINAPIVGKHSDPIVAKQGLNFDEISHLDDLGLITFGQVSGFTIAYDTEFIRIETADSMLRLSKEDKQIPIGSVRLSYAGRQIAQCLEVAADPELTEYAKKYWVSQGVAVEKLAVVDLNLTVTV